MPKRLPKNRMHVDPGSALFIQVMKNMPVLAPEHEAFVSRAVRETSLLTMVGVPHTEDDVEQENSRRQEEDEDVTELNQPDGADEQENTLAAQIKAANGKRKLYRQHTGTEVQWFPHDNAIEFY